MIHYIKNISLKSDVPNNLKEIILGAGCFWGVEKKFWDLDGVYLTSWVTLEVKQKIQLTKMSVTKIPIMLKL